MIVLLGIGFVAGIVTAISPCVLPVLPILLAGGASGRNPLRIVAGLVVSFTVFTLFASWLLSQLGLPQDFLRNLAIVLLFVTAATLLVPRAALLIERPLAFFSRLRPTNVGGGFLLGATLGLVFVPCAGPVLATVTVVAAKNEVGVRAILLTLAYAVGAAVPMLAIAFGGREAAASLRRHAQPVRMASGALIASGRARSRLPPRRSPGPAHAGLHELHPEQGRGQRDRQARARRRCAAAGRPSPR